MNGTNVESEIEIGTFDVIRWLNYQGSEVDSIFCYPVLDTDGDADPVGLRNIAHDLLVVVEEIREVADLLEAAQ